MSWNSIVSGTMLEAPIVPATRVEPLVVHRHDRHVRLDRRERVVRRLGARARERVEQRRLARVGHPDDPDLHHRPEAPDDGAERGAGRDVGRVVHAEVEPRERHRGRRAPSSGPRGSSGAERLRGRERRRRVRRREREAGRRGHQVREVLDQRPPAADRELDRGREQVGAADARPSRAPSARAGRRSTARRARRARATPPRARPGASSAAPSARCSRRVRERRARAGRARGRAR